MAVQNISRSWAQLFDSLRAQNIRASETSFSQVVGMMDHEKPQAVYPNVYEYSGTQSRSVDDSETQHGVTPDIDMDLDIEEPAPVEERRERRGESLWRVLNERQINMIAFSGTIGNGLFLGSGATVALAGPGGAILAYALMGTVVSAVMSSFGEMTALMPVNAPMMEFPRRFVDRGLGFAVGWMYWFASAVLAADELTAVTRVIQFKYDDGRTNIHWLVGDNVDPAVWMTLFLVLVITINMFPVKWFGELEYIFGCFKLIFISMLIVMMLILAVMKPRTDAYYTQPLGTTYWDTPYGFFNKVYKVEDENGNVQRIITGSLGTFLGEWQGTIRAIFSFTGMDIFAATAAESRRLGDAESMKMAARKISIRIVTIYAFAVFTASFTVPFTHPFLNGEATSVGASSIFVIAVVEAGIPSAAHFFNAVFILSTFTCAINSMFVASRVLHTLALRDQTGPEWITRRLRQCRNGVPTRAVLVTSMVAVLGYMGRTGKPYQRLSQISQNCTVSYLILYASICATYLAFFKVLEDVKMYGNASEAQAASYDRNHPRYPYKSHGQWLKAAYGLAACLLLLLFNGLFVFLENPFDYQNFIVSYIGIPVFLLLIAGYKLRRHGFNFSQWGPERSCDLSGAIQASTEKRKGRLEFPDNSLTKDNVLTFIKWVWAWMK